MLRLRSVGKKLTEVTADDFKNVVKGEAKTINVMGVDFPTVVLEDGKQLLIHEADELFRSNDEVQRNSRPLRCKASSH